MPTIVEGNKVAVSVSELVPDYYASWNTLKTALTRYKNRFDGIKRLERGGGKGRVVLIDFDTLSVDIRAKLGDPRRVDHPLELYYEIDADAQVFVDTEKMKGQGLKEDQKETIVINASVLKAAQAFREASRMERMKCKISTRGLDHDVFERVMSFNDVLWDKYEVRHSLPNNYRRYVDKLRQFEKEGYMCLVHKNFGNKNATKMTDTTGDLLERMFAKDKTKPTPTEVARRYEAFLNGYFELINPTTGEFYEPKNFKKLSSSTIRKYLATWETKVATHRVRTANRQQYMSEYEGWVSLKQPQYAGSIISIDDRQPPFEYDAQKRMWFYNGIDLASEAFTVFVWGKTKEGIILEFYREMVRNYTEWGFNLPAEVECESNLNALYRETFLKEGRMFRYVRIEANKARAKRIEAYYKSLRYDHEKKREGWLGRPFALSEPNQKAPDVPRVPYNQLVRDCLKDIQNWNNMEHSKIKGKTRWEVFKEKQNPHLRPTNWQGILPYLGYETKATCKAGNVKFQNTFFLLGDNAEILKGDDLIATLKIVERKELKIFWIDGHDGDVLKAIAYIDGRYVCELIRKPLVNRAQMEQTDIDRANMAIVSAYNNTINGYASGRIRGYDDLVQIDNRPVTLNDGFQIPYIMEEARELVSVENMEVIEVDAEESFDIPVDFEQQRRRRVAMDW